MEKMAEGPYTLFSRSVLEVPSSARDDYGQQQQQQQQHKNQRESCDRSRNEMDVEFQDTRTETSCAFICVPMAPAITERREL